MLAAYVLTALVDRPGRLVYLGSGMHRGGTPNLDDVDWTKRRWSGAQAYSDTKLFDVVLAFGMARRWSDVLSNAIEPGWVATRMGGPGAPDDLEAAPVTQCWLAVSEDPEARTTGGYWYHQRRRDAHPATSDPRFQDELDRLLRVAQRGATARLTRAATSGPGGRPRRTGGGRGGRSA